MNIDDLGVITFSEQDIIHEMYKNPKTDPSEFLTDFYISQEYNIALKSHYDNSSSMETAHTFTKWGIDEFDKTNQDNWYMPDEYKQVDIAAFVLSECKTDSELQRCGEELIMFQERGMFDVLRYLKYFVDTMREHKKVWGVGRGSSVSSYVLYILGVHRVDSLYYELSIDEFLR